ncbi:MAG: hypothetical protein HY040_21505 [Planctomycetes bacterium]|nr:hypothetical protein [Planctomycetota bacterium]
MLNNVEILIGMAALGFTALVVFSLYKLRQKKRVRRVEGWVKDYLVFRYGELPNPLSINCSNDALWPVLVAFEAPLTRIRHSLQLTFGGVYSTLKLLSEKEENR